MIYIKHKPNRIIVHDGPLEGLVGCFLKNLFGIKFYYILTGPLWEFEKERMVKSKSFNKMLRKIKYIIFNYLYNLTMQKSSLIHPISNQMSQVYFKTEFRKKTHPISECASSKFLNYNSGNKNKKSSSKFIFYIGTISENRDIKFLLNSFLIATKKADDIKLVFLGWGSKAYLEDLNIYINKLGITDKVIFLGKVPYNKVPQFLSKAHIGVSPIPLSKKFLVSTPTKVIDYLSLGITVVANKEIEDQKNIIEESGGGLTTPYNEKSFGNAIATLCNDDYRAHEMGIAGKKWVTKNRSFRLISKDLDTLYSKNIKA